MNNQTRNAESNDTQKLIHLIENAKDILGDEGKGNESKGIEVSKGGGHPAQRMWISKLGTINLNLDFDYESAKSEEHYRQANERNHFELLFDGDDFVLAKHT